MKSKIIYAIDSWEWFGHAAHFICADKCRFHLATKVGPYLVSTIGELWHERSVHEIHAEINDPVWYTKNVHLKGDAFDAAYMERFGFSDIGCDRKYESMVFIAGKRCECGCNLPSIASSEIDYCKYNNAGEATVGHLNLCNKWSMVDYSLYASSYLDEKISYKA